jgi:predicted nucleic acid-binding protein
VKVALDTTILVFAEGVNGQPKEDAALDVLDKLRPKVTLVAPAQTLGELFAVLVRKAGRSPADARRAILAWRAVTQAADTTDSVLFAATDLALNKFSIWDAVIVCAAAEAACQMLLSEDMQDGFVWRGVTIVNPFAKTKHPLLQALMPCGKPFSLLY